MRPALMRDYRREPNVKDFLNLVLETNERLLLRFASSRARGRRGIGKSSTSEQSEEACVQIWRCGDKSLRAPPRFWRETPLLCGRVSKRYEWKADERWSGSLGGQDNRVGKDGSTALGGCACFPREARESARS